MDNILSDAIDALNVPLFILDKNLDYIYVNSPSIKLFGYSREEFLSFNSLELTKNGIIGHSLSEKVRKSGNSLSAKQFMVKKNGGILEFTVTSNPVYDGNGEIKYMVGLLKDIISVDREYIDAHYTYNSTSLTDEAKGSEFENKIIANNPAMKNLIEKINEISKYDTSILILGETGIGKEVVASLIHSKSKRSDREMIKINCASLPDTLLEAELFGYEEGSFTGALKKGKKGLIELANKSTLFLDEIDSLPLALQGKLLRALDSKKIRKIGSNKEVYVDFKLVTATNANLKSMVENKEFREDLYYRINIVPVMIPPLRLRVDDIKPLCMYFLDMYCSKYNKEKYFSDDVYEVLKKYQWPGNVRELKNFVEMMVVTSSVTDKLIRKIPKNYLGGKHGVNQLNGLGLEIEPGESNGNTFDIDKMNHEEIMNELDREIIKTALEKYRTTYEAARILGLHQSTVARKKKKYNL